MPSRCSTVPMLNRKARKHRLAERRRQRRKGTGGKPVSKATSETFMLHLRVEVDPLTRQHSGPGRDPAIRLRRLPKFALRSEGLRCTAIRPSLPGETVCSCQAVADSRSRPAAVS